MNRIQIAVPLALLAALAIVEAPACKPGQVQTITNTLSPAAACIVEQLVQGGASDPLQIVAACAGTTITDVIAVIEELIAAQPADAGTTGLSVRLADMHAKALAAKAAGK